MELWIYSTIFVVLIRITNFNYTDLKNLFITFAILLITLSLQAETVEQYRSANTTKAISSVETLLLKGSISTKLYLSGFMFKTFKKEGFVISCSPSNGWKLNKGNIQITWSVKNNITTWIMTK